MFKNYSPPLPFSSLGRLALGLALNFLAANVSVTGFNDATTNNVQPIPEPVSILGSLMAVDFGTLFKSKKNLRKL